MKSRLKWLIWTYTQMLAKERSKLRREVLWEVIVDLKAILEEAQ
jgi:hypothetical protein